MSVSSSSISFPLFCHQMTWILHIFFLVPPPSYPQVFVSCVHILILSSFFLCTFSFNYTVIISQKKTWQLLTMIPIQQSISVYTTLVVFTISTLSLPLLLMWIGIVLKRFDFLLVPESNWITHYNKVEDLSVRKWLQLCLSNKHPFCLNSWPHPLPCYIVQIILKFFFETNWDSWDSNTMDNLMKFFLTQNWIKDIVSLNTLLQLLLFSMSNKKKRTYSSYEKERAKRRRIWSCSIFKGGVWHTSTMSEEQQLLERMIYKTSIQLWIIFDC